MTTDLYDFLKRWYKPSRFEGRNRYWPDYSESITKSYHDWLAKDGQAFIPKFESVTGLEIVFDANLNILNHPV